MGDINSPSENSEFVLCLLYFVVLLFFLFFIFLSLSLSPLSLLSLSLLSLCSLSLSLSSLSLSPYRPLQRFSHILKASQRPSPPNQGFSQKFGFRFSKNVLFIHLILFIATAVAGEDERKKMHSKMFAYQWLIKDAHKNGQFHTRGRERE